MQTNNNNKSRFYNISSLMRHQTVAIARLTVREGKAELHSVVTAAWRGKGDVMYVIHMDDLMKAFVEQAEKGIGPTPVRQLRAERPRVDVHLSGNQQYMEIVEAASPGGFYAKISMALSNSGRNRVVSVDRLDTNWKGVSGAGVALPFPQGMSEEGTAFSVVHPTANAVLKLLPIHGGAKPMELEEDGRPIPEGVADVIKEREEFLSSVRVDYRYAAQKLVKQLDPKSLAELAKIDPKQIAAAIAAAKAKG